jgi:hypothetical protein
MPTQAEVDAARAAVDNLINTEVPAFERNMINEKARHRIVDVVLDAAERARAEPGG